MKRQVLLGALLVGMLTVAPVSASITDFSTDPNLETEWTQFDYYNYFGVTTDTTTCTWNSTNQNLDLTSNMGEETADRYRALYKTGETRSDTDGVTVRFSDYVGSWLNAEAHNTGVGLVVSSVEQGTIVTNVPQYELHFSQEGGGYHYVVLKNGVATYLASTDIVAELPSTIELGILVDGSEYVFMANGEELVRDSSITESMPYYCLTWAVSGENTLSVSADDYGTIPEQGTPLPGDLNDDGFVGGDDLDIVRSFWGQNVTPGDLLQGDPSGDGFVGGDDLDVVRAHWGEGTPPAPGAVPEPATLTLLLGAMLSWFVPRRRGAVK